MPPFPLLQIFDTNGMVLYLINGGDEKPVSWLSCVQSARCDLEQNIEMLQIGPDIYYRTIKVIYKCLSGIITTTTYRLFFGFILNF